MKIVPVMMIAAACAVLASCATVRDLQDGELARSLGSFRLQPVAPGTYWYDGTTYEYNQYEIEIVSEPCSARIIWDGRYIGQTPFVYSFSGALDRDDRVLVKAVPDDPALEPQEAALKIRQELPRKIQFDLRGK